MKKNNKDVFVKALTASATQAISITAVISPITSIAAVTGVAIVSGFTEKFLARRSSDLEQLSTELTDPATAKIIKEMQEDQFLDDLSFSMERILKQRLDTKRILMRKAFLGYLKTEHKASYPLEKIYNVIENLSFADIAFFRRIFDADKLRKTYKLPWVSKEIMINHKVPEIDQEKMIVLTYSADGQDQQSKISLITEGLVIERNEGLGTWDSGGGTPQLYITQFGHYFKKHLIGLREF